MKKIISLILIFTISTQIFSQIDSTKVAFVSYWSVGDSYDFKITKIKQQWKEGKLIKNKKQIHRVNFKVIDSTAKSYTIKWSYNNDELYNILKKTYKLPDSLLKNLSKYFLTEVKYKTSELGNIVEVLNWKEISNTMNKIFDLVIEIAAKNDSIKKKSLSNSMQPLRQIFNSKEAVEQLILQDIQVFHLPLGLEFDTTTPLVFDDELPNILDNNPIKAKSKIYFEKIDYENDLCVFKYDTDIPHEETLKLIKDLMSKIKITDKEMDKFLKTAVFSIKDRNVFEYYFYPGIPKKIVTNRETIINFENKKEKRLEKMIIELITD